MENNRDIVDKAEKNKNSTHENNSVAGKNVPYCPLGTIIVGRLVIPVSVIKVITKRQGR